LALPTAGGATAAQIRLTAFPTVMVSILRRDLFPTTRNRNVKQRRRDNQFLFGNKGPRLLLALNGEVLEEFRDAILL
jgi:hypothetical protein